MLQGSVSNLKLLSSALCSRPERITNFSVHVLRQSHVLRAIEWDNCVAFTLINQQCKPRYFNNSPSKVTDSATEKKPPASTGRKNKQNVGPIITLIGTDNTPSIVSLSDADKLAKRRDLKLVKLVDNDTKTQRPIYQLMTGAQYYEEDRKLRQEKATKKEHSIKGDKLLTLSHRIDEHDLSSRIKNISKWLSKTYEVRVVINGETGNMTLAEKVYDFIAENVKTEGRVVQKRQKGSDIRFQILPPKKEKMKEDSSEAKTSDSESV